MVDTVPRFPELTLEGSPREMGHQQVEQLGKDAIMHIVREGLRITTDYGDRPDFADYLVTADRTLRAWAPHLAQEIEGIAEACGLPYAELLAHNYYTTFRGIYAGRASQEQCSCVAMADTDAGPVFGKNNDATFGPEGCYIARRRPDGRQSFLDYTYYGLVSVVAGMNESGFCVGGASMGPLRGLSVSATDIPVMMILRRWLEELTTVYEALELARTEPVDHGANYMIADASTVPGLVHIEWAKRDHLGVQWPDEQGNLMCANIVFTPEVGPLLDPDGGDIITNSRDRLASMAALLATAPRTVEGVKAIMSSHELPGVVCQHDGMGSSIMNTELSSVFVPRRQTVWISHGIPCKNGYGAYRV